MIECWSLENSVDAGRGRKYDLIVVDEAGLVPSLRQWWDLAARATLIDRRGRAVFISTPNVIGPDFDDIFELAASGDDPEWKSFTAPTFSNPHLPADELEAIKRLIKTLPEWVGRQEYYAIPAPQAGTFFPRDVIRMLIGECEDPVRVGHLQIDGKPIEQHTPQYVERVIRTRRRDLIDFVEAEDGPWKLWIDDPDLEAPYSMGADLGAGVGAANTVLSVGDGRNKRKVAEYATPGVTPERAAVQAAIGGLWFGGGVIHEDDERRPAAAMMPEINGPGEVFVRELMRLNYPAILSQEHHTGDVSMKDPSLLGWRSSPQAKETLLSAYRGALQTRRFHNPSAAALAECMTFRYGKTGKLESIKATKDPTDDIARAPHGDRVISDALLWDAYSRVPPIPAREVVGIPGSMASRILRPRVKRRRSGYTS
jgi:hypothetical protein